LEGESPRVSSLNVTLGVLGSDDTGEGGGSSDRVGGNGESTESGAEGEEGKLSTTTRN
jgi:hypothetical protein